jgi:ferredoxin
VAGVIQQQLIERGANPFLLDLGREGDWSSALELFEKAPAGNVLFIGSPVYRDLAVPPVMQFIEALPRSEMSFAVPFVTWGGASSGIALWQMGRALVGKGFSIAGAAKILGVHSLMWDETAPLGNGHPDAEDDRMIEQLVKTVMADFEHGHERSLSLEQLDYQPEAKIIEMRKKLTNPPPGASRVVVEERCTQCALCEQECPAGAITLTPYPEFSSDCFDCFNCVRLCPEGAIQLKSPLEKLLTMIRKHAEKMNETPPSQIIT